MPPAQLVDQPANGGFPEPPASGPIRVVVARHARCNGRTRVRLPGVLPATAVRRLRCAGCHSAYEADWVEEVGLEDVAARRWPGFDPRGRVWRWASIPVGVAAVGGVLLLIQGGGEPATSEGGGAPAPAPAAAGDPAGAAEGAEEARLVRGSRYALALPAGWRRTPSDGGAAFTAVAAGGGADATLWIERAPGLDFPTFERRSLQQLEELAGGAEVVDRVSAPTREGTIVRLAADAPEGQPRLEVTLRAAGPYRYYLATTVQPDAPREAAGGAELIHGSFTPESDGSG